ncbi:MAG: hypothetical protein K940chlam7_00349 [Chlamydiae bacterium]|nr:hypothetical protein [Chlamydiota bacterium]
MKRQVVCILSILMVLVTLFPSLSYSLERDYAYRGAYLYDDWDLDEEDENEDYTYSYNSNELCYRCFDRACWHSFPLKHKKELDIGVIPPIVNQTCNECWWCCDPVVYVGYFHFRHKGGYPFLKRQIEYSRKYPHHQAYWPETSHRAEKISDVAVVLFENLIDSTALKKVKQRSDLSNNFITDSWYFRRLGFNLPRSLSVCCFRFSDFYQVCKDLERFSQTYFSEEEIALIEDKTDAILDRLCEMFLEMYEESLSFHPTAEIQSEINFIELLYSPERDIKVSSCQKENESQHFSGETKIDIFKKRLNKRFKVKESVSDSNSLPDWLISDYWLYEGIRCNNLFLHSEAITYLTAAIEKDPSNVEAYQERIHAHFEMGNLSLAIEDYNKLKHLEVRKKEISFNKLGYVVKNDSDQGNYVVNPKPKVMVDYSGGFCIGIARGSSVAVVEFVPSTWSCCKGILHGLWSFACSPVEVSKDLINTSYELVEYLKENTARECLEAVVPELKDLCVNWDTLSDYDRGNKTGYIIGKYGVDILAPGAVMKGVKKYRQLKRLNSMFTVECCVVSEAKKAKILEASSRHSAIRTTVSDLAKTGKIIPGNANVIPHVMQEKHAWEKIIKMSGNKVEDFGKVSTLLEESGILSEKYLLESEKFHNGKIIRSDYRKFINGREVQASFETYIETNQTFLKDAWVITKK